MRFERDKIPAVFLPLLAYVILFMLSFYPQSSRPWDTVAYIGDSLEAVWLIGWNVHQFFSNPMEILEANILYPNPLAMTYTDHRILISLLVAPVIWVTENPVLAYNVALALGCLLAALAARWLALRLGCDSWGAWAAGALYGFHTYMINEGPRLHIIYHGFIPLALERLVAFLKTGRPRYAVHCAALMILQGLCSSYHVLYGALLLALVTLGALVFRPRKTIRRLPALTLTGFGAVVLYAPIVIPYISSASLHGFRHELPRGVDLVHYFSTTPTNLMYGPIGTEVRIQQQAPHFVGFFTLALAIFAIAAWALRWGTEKKESLLPLKVWIPSATLLALFFVALSLGKDVKIFGHEIGPGVYRLLYDWVPGFKQVRIPERLSLLAMLFIALLVARAITVIGATRMKRLAALLTIVVPLEHLSPLPFTERVPVWNEVPAVYRWLREQEVRALAEVPIHGEALIRKESLQMYFSTYHLKPIIHGYESFPPLMTSILRMLAEDFPSEASLQAFQRVGLDTVVVHLGIDNSERILRSLPDRIHSGRLVPYAKFAGPGAHVYQGTVDEVYRLVPTKSLPAASFPRGRRLLDENWRYRTKEGDPEPAADGDLATAWTVTGPLDGDEFYEVTFDRPVRVSGLVMRFRRDSRFPNVFKVAGRDIEGRWIPLAWFDGRHKLQLLDHLLADPTNAAVGFDIGVRELTGLMIMVEPEGQSHFGWSVPEIEVWVP